MTVDKEKVRIVTLQLMDATFLPCIRVKGIGILEARVTQFKGDDYRTNGKKMQ